MEKEALHVGISGRGRLSVTEATAASSVGSGCLPVFATPSMIALMERTAAESLLPYLEEGCSTVGVHLDVKHLSATPIGMSVRCETELVALDRRKLTFACKVYDDTGLVGEGMQERFLVDNERFMAKTMQKMEAGENG